MKFLLASAMLISGFCGTVHAQLTGIYVEFYTSADQCPNNPSFGDGWAPVPGFANRGATCPGSSPQAGLSYGSSVSFFGNSGTTYRIFAVDASQPIGNITVFGSGVTVLVGRSVSSFPPFTSTTGPLAVAGGGSIGAVNVPNGTVQIRSTDSVQSVNADAVVRVDARNSIGSVSANQRIDAVRAPLIAGTVFGTSVGRVDVWNWDVTPGIPEQDLTWPVQASVGDIDRVEALGNARILSTVSADNGRVLQVISNSSYQFPLILARNPRNQGACAAE